MGSFLEKYNCSEMEDICWSLIDLFREIIKKIPDKSEREQWRRKINIYDRLFDEDSSLSWKEAQDKINTLTPKGE